jgi:hypothetical protein
MHRALGLLQYELKSQRPDGRRRRFPKKPQRRHCNQSKW